MLLLTHSNCGLVGYANSRQRRCTALNNDTHTSRITSLKDVPTCLSLSHLLSHRAHILPLDLFSYSEAGPCSFSATTYLTPSHLFDGNSKSWQFPHAISEGRRFLSHTSQFRKTLLMLRISRDRFSSYRSFEPATHWVVTTHLLELLPMHRFSGRISGFSLTCHSRWMVSLIHWIYVTYPSGKQPTENISRGEPHSDFCWMNLLSQSMWTNQINFLLPV